MGICYLHIGMHKTGSTSIQRTLREQWIDGANILHAKITSPSGLPFPNHTVPLGSIFSPRLRKANGVDQALADSYKLELETFLAENKGKSVLFSGEGLPKFSPPQLIKLKNFLSPYFDEIQVLAYVRSPRLYMSSAFQQIAKRSAVEVSSSLERVYPRYQQRFEKFIEIFGKDNVKLWKFEPKEFAGGCVVNDFSKRLNSSIDTKKVIRVNEGLSREAMILIQVYFRFCRNEKNRHSKRSVSVAVKLQKYLSDLTGDKLKIDPAKLDEVVERNLEDIAWMEEALGETLYDKQLKDSGSSAQYISNDEDLLSPSFSSLKELVKIFETVSKKKANFSIDEKEPAVPQAVKLLRFIIDESGFEKPKGSAKKTK